MILADGIAETRKVGVKRAEELVENVQVAAHGATGGVEGVGDGGTGRGNRRTLRVER